MFGIWRLFGLLFDVGCVGDLSLLWGFVVTHIWGWFFGGFLGSVLLVFV